jgi:outer membrane biosynthesis protein TonB
MLGEIGKTLIILGDNAELIRRSVRNIDQILTINAREINALHIVTAKTIVITKEALEILEQRLQKKTMAKKIVVDSTTKLVEKPKPKSKTKPKSKPATKKVAPKTARTTKKKPTTKKVVKKDQQ